MGAATAFNKKYKNGGLRRMLQQQVSFLTAENTSDSHSNLHHACLLRNRVTDLRTSINMLCRHLSQAVGDKSTQISQSIANNLAHQVLCASKYLNYDLKEKSIYLPIWHVLTDFNAQFSTQKHNY